MTAATDNLNIKTGDAITLNWLGSLETELRALGKLDAKSRESIRSMKGLVSRRIALTFKANSEAFVLLNRCHMADCGEAEVSE